MTEENTIIAISFLWSAALLGFAIGYTARNSSEASQRKYVILRTVVVSTLLFGPCVGLGCLYMVTGVVSLIAGIIYASRKLLIKQPLILVIFLLSLGGTVQSQTRIDDYSLYRMFSGGIYHQIDTTRITSLHQYRDLLWNKNYSWVLNHPSADTSAPLSGIKRAYIISGFDAWIGDVTFQEGRPISFIKNDGKKVRIAALLCGIKPIFRVKIRTRKRYVMSYDIYLL